MSLPTHQPEETVRHYIVRTRAIGCTADHDRKSDSWIRLRPSRANQPSDRQLWHRAIRRQQLRRLRREIDRNGFEADPDLRIGYDGIA